MDIWDEIQKLSGYQSGNGGVDSYGVDHSGFSTRDELEYQSARLARENQLAEGFAQQGIAQENYPQYGTTFWGGSAENNYGFGTSNISQNIQNVTNQLNNSGFGNGLNNGVNGINNGQVFANSDYTVNTESLVGKPSSYFQNNNTSNISGSNTSGWSGNTNNLNSTANGGFNQNTNFGTNLSSVTTPMFQNQTPTPWSYNEPQTTPTPWNNPATQVTPSPWVDNSLTEDQRIRALRYRKPLNLYMGNAENANYEWPWYAIGWLGKYYVDKHNNVIEKYAIQNNIDPDLVRAVMYNEGATGHKGIFNYLGDLIGKSGSQMPMNIQGKTWGDFDGKHYDTYIPQQNIELGTKVLKQMQNSLNEPTPDRVGTLWNETGANNINDVGARVKTAYDTKPWLGEKQWEQKLLEFFFGNKKK